MLKLAKDADLDNYIYTLCGIEFDSRSELSFLKLSNFKIVIIFVVDMSSSVHIDNKKKDIFILGINPAQGLDDIMLSTEA